jgi:release factor glutamine methyltransferase
LEVVEALRAGGCVAAEDEADLLLTASARTPIAELITRRLSGEPLAWILGHVTFCGIPIHIDPGVFVPRPHTEALGRRAASLLPEKGIAVDLCTGSGAIAAVMSAARPRANVYGIDIELLAVRCAARNRVAAIVGDLDTPLASEFYGQVDLVTGVVPYVPTEELHLLPRDVLAMEPRVALDGGIGGTQVLLRATGAAARLLRTGGNVLLEVGGTQAQVVGDALEGLGFEVVDVLRDEDDQGRAIHARLERSVAT